MLESRPSGVYTGSGRLWSDSLCIAEHDLFRGRLPDDVKPTCHLSLKSSGSFTDPIFVKLIASRWVPMEQKKLGSNDCKMAGATHQCQHPVDTFYCANLNQLLADALVRTSSPFSSWRTLTGSRLESESTRWFGARARFVSGPSMAWQAQTPLRRRPPTRGSGATTATRSWNCPGPGVELHGNGSKIFVQELACF